MDKCIGCGTCETICQNAAIDMVPVEGEDAKDGDSGLRPRIDYGRCCWCALCVDICATNSLTMSNEYVWIDEDKLKEKLLRVTLKNIENQITDKNILRCHRSFIINANVKYSILGNSNGYHLKSKFLQNTIPVSRSLGKEIVDKLKDS